MWQLLLPLVLATMNCLEALGETYCDIFSDAVTSVINDSLRTPVDNWDPRGSLSYPIYPPILPLSRG